MTTQTEYRIWLNFVTGEVPEDTARSVDDGRVILTLSADDRNAFDNLPKPSRKGVVVTDLATGARWRLRRERCGLGCHCAAGGEVLS